MGEFDESAPAASFPVVFFDGKREINVGNVVVHPAIEFVRFQMLISQKVGISPQEITTHLVHRKKGRTSVNTCPKVLIDGSSDFSSIARERDCVILAKRSRRARSRRRGGGFAGALEHKKAAAIQQDKTILKRNQADGLLIDVPFGGRIQSPAGLGFYNDYGDSLLRNLQMQRELFLLSAAAAYSPYAAINLPDPASFGWEQPEILPATAISAVCEDCLRAEEDRRPAGFHWCVYDAVTVGFRSPVGPIQRPPKKHIEASA